MSNEQREGTVGEVIDGRVSVYGDPKETFGRIAQMWSGLFGIEVHDWQVPLAMQAMKLIRTTQAPDYSDNTDDIEGYLDIFRQLIGEDMVHARSVTEYLEEKEKRKTIRIEQVEPEPEHIMLSSQAVTEAGAIWLCSVCDWVGHGDRVTARGLFRQHHEMEK